MSLPVSPRWRPLLPVALVAPLAVLSALRLAQRGAVPWTPIAGVAVATAVVAGPGAWLARARIPEERRERLTLVAAGVTLLLVPIGLGLALVVDFPLIPSLDGLLVGAFVGVLMALTAEQTVVPDHLRGSE